MNITDPISDYLTRVRNAIKAKHKRVDIPASNLKRDLSILLKELKYINDYSEIADNKQGIIRLSLKYKDGQNVIKGLRRISKPGLRVYTNAEEIPRVFGGLGIAVVSTSKGLMTGHKARQLNIGGEILCYIW